MDKMEMNTQKAVGILVVSSLALGIFIGYLTHGEIFQNLIPGGDQGGYGDKSENRVAKFESKEDFINYLSEAQGQRDYFYNTGFAQETTLRNDLGPGGFSVPSSGKDAALPSRYSDTNVQVKGIDEPDIVKTDGKNIYYASELYGYYFREPMPLPMTDIPSKIAPYPPYQDERETKIITAFPPEDIKQAGQIDRFGELLLDKNILIVFSQADNALVGYDVSKPEAPDEKWKISMEQNSYVVSARLHEGTVYVITSTNVNYTDPCPVRPLRVDGTVLEIPCNGIYHPVLPTEADVTYTAIAIDPASGKTQKNVSFVGSSGGSVVYMSADSIYLTYPLAGDVFAFFTGFLKDKGADLVPAQVINKLDKVATYDISSAAKLMELQLTLEKFLGSVDADERRRIENEFQNRAKDYYKEHGRDIGKTGIVRIDARNLTVEASGSVPGSPLNQFSLDEHENNLRIATTIGGNIGFYGFGMSGNSESANDVYVLNQKLGIIGSVTDLGITERIYSARFLGDKAYLVTFRQIDPFYVLDLSNPRKPERKGELKIPGYSSYLHPIDQDHVLGVGQDGGNVKLSYFDVSDPTNPREQDKYILNEYWSEVANNHHAFLMDEQNKVFFIPGGGSGYIFSYKDNKLELARAVSNIQAKRAVFIDKYLYVLGQDRIVVLDENDWNEVAGLGF